MRYSIFIKITRKLSFGCFIIANISNDINEEKYYYYIKFYTEN